MIPAPLGHCTVAHRHIEISLGVYRWSRRFPYPALTWSRHLVGEERSRPICAQGNNQAAVVATVTVQPSKGDIDAASRQGKGRTLLIGSRVYAGRIYNATDFDLPCFDINADE